MACELECGEIFHNSFYWWSIWTKTRSKWLLLPDGVILGFPSKG